MELHPLHLEVKINKKDWGLPAGPHVAFLPTGPCLEEVLNSPVPACKWPEWTFSWLLGSPVGGRLGRFLSKRNHKPSLISLDTGSWEVVQGSYLMDSASEQGLQGAAVTTSDLWQVSCE